MLQHCEPEDLALVALGEHIPACQEHIETCRMCREQADELRELVTTARAGGGPDSLVEPPTQVWDRISTQLESEPVPLRGRSAPAQMPHSSRPDPATLADTPPVRRGFPRWAGLVAATAAGALLGGAVVTTVTGTDTPTSVVASAELTPMPDGPDRGGEADATLNRTDDGYTVTVKATDLQGPEGFYEVWLLDEQNSGLIALGSIAPGEKQATFPVPDGVDLESFNAVDISDEPLDGDPTHSTVTVLRGTLVT